VLCNGVGEIIASEDYYRDATKLVLVTNAKSISRSQLCEAVRSGVLVATLNLVRAEAGLDFIKLLA
jgi:hypothetical protein